MKTKLFLIASLSFLSPAFSQVSKSEAWEMKSKIDTMCSDFTDTMVVPTNHPDCVIIVSMKVLQNQKSANLWLLISSAVVAKSGVNVKEIWFADIATMREKPLTAKVLSVDVAKSIQSRLHNGTITIETAFSEIRRHLVTRTMKS